MRYKLKATEEFWADFEQAAEYIGGTLKNRAAADKLLDELRKNAQIAADFPKATRPFVSPPEVDADYYAVQVGNYFAFYVVIGSVVEFRRFLYAKSDLPNQLMQ